VPAVPGPRSLNAKASAKQTASANANKSGAAVQSASDAEISARSTKRAAWVAAGAAILAALIAFGGIWWSARVAAESRSHTATTQLSGEIADRSRAEFLLGQRQVLYTKFIRHEVQLENAELEAARAINPMGPPHSPQLEQKLQDMDDLLTTLKYDVSAAQIIGSPAVRSLVNRIHYRHLLITIRVQMLSDPEITAGASSKLDHQWSEYSNQKDKLLGEFIKVAQKDIGSE
jgi:hypothetical protein